MNAMLLAIRTKFSDVIHISTETLASWVALQDDEIGELDQDSEPRALLEQGASTQESGKPKGKIILLDVREEDEYNVSHLLGARRIQVNLTSEQTGDHLKEITAPFLDKDPDAALTMVCYCSLGYRSSEMVRKIKSKIDDLQTTVPVEVFNLEGSIFKWANENRELVDNSGNKTIYVHPYNAVFGLALNKELRKYK